MPHTLIMPIVAPMQSWGYRSRFENRETGPEPTRSGIIGLLCAAMGIPRHQDLSAFDKLRMGTRIDKPGSIKTDFHTVLNVVSASGKPGKNAVISRRQYLSDARFIVGLENDDFDFLKTIETALRAPRWPLYLGRKSFPLALPPYLPVKSILNKTSLLEALEKVPFFKLKESENYPEQPLRISVESTGSGQHETLVMDAPVSFSKRKFRQRALVNHWLPEEKTEKGGLWI